MLTLFTGNDAGKASGSNDRLSVGLNRALDSLRGEFQLLCRNNAFALFFPHPQ